MDGDMAAGADCPDEPADRAGLSQRVRQEFEAIIGFCLQSDETFRSFEDSFRLRLFRLACLLVRLFLAARHERFDATPSAGWRLGNPAARRTIKTCFGVVSYARTQWHRKGRGGESHHPLDAELGLTRDGFSPWMIQFVTRLATRMSFAAGRLVCEAALGWSPSTASVERLALGLGRQAEAFVRQQAAPEGDGEVLVIEVDGKCPPTATEEELRKRRGRRKTKPGGCKCQRHRGQAKRKGRGRRKRRKKGDKSKNGKEVVVVVMYTLRRGEDGRLHGPLNKRVWASFGNRRGAAVWARAEATKRGFGPDTEQTVQVVLDGASGLKSNMQEQFPKGVFTIDVCHVVEKLWTLAHRFHAEGSDELKSRVEGWKEWLYAGRAADLVAEFRRLLEQTPVSGPGNKAKRTALEKTIGYMEPRIGMMKYAEWRARDLVVASGQVEGAVRHLVGERFDCAGMRWIPGRAEALLHLRCVELNGDWDEFIAWSEDRFRKRLLNRETVLIRSNQPLPCGFATAA